MILAIDTSNSFCSVAIHLDNKFYSRELKVNNSHSEVIAKLFQEVLEETKKDAKEITQLVVGLGPGSFTGLRIGLAFSLGISTGLGIPICGFSSFQALSVKQEGRVQVVSDARKEEYYAGEYSAGDVVQAEGIILSSELKDGYFDINTMHDPEVAVGLIKLYLNDKKPVYNDELSPIYVRELAAKKIKERY